MAERLFYSPADKSAFYIPDYYPDRLKAVEQIQMLNEETDNFLTMLKGTNIAREDIYTREITDSRRYKSMRVWWATATEAPEGAFILTEENGWTMEKWIKG